MPDRAPPPSHARGDRHIFFHLKLVSQVALGIGVLAAASFLLLVATLKTDPFGHYADIIASFRLTRQNLLPATLLTALVLLTATGLVTWLVALYSSFRIAGPLYRFARNLEATIADGPGRPLRPIRRTDELHAEAAALRAASTALAQQYATMRSLVDRAQRELLLDVPDTDEHIRQVVRDLRAADAQVHL